MDELKPPQNLELNADILTTRLLTEGYRNYLDKEYIEYFLKNKPPLIANVEDLYDGRYIFTNRYPRSN